MRYYNIVLAIIMISLLASSTDSATGICRATELQYNQCQGSYGDVEENLTMNIGNFTEVCIGNVCMSSWSGIGASDFWLLNGNYLTFNTTATGGVDWLNITALYLDEVNIVDIFQTQLTNSSNITVIENQIYYNGSSGTTYTGGANISLAGNVISINMSIGGGATLTEKQVEDYINNSDLFVLNNSVEILKNLTVDNNTLFVDNSNHRVGIGTNIPGRVLDIFGRIRLRGNPAGGIGTAGIWFSNWSGTELSFFGVVNETAPDTVGFWNNGWNFVLDNNGNVGIGIGQKRPDSRLEVNGNLTVQNVTISTNLALLNFQSCNLETNANGIVVCGTDDTGGAGGASNWNATNVLKPANATLPVHIYNDEIRICDSSNISCICHKNNAWHIGGNCP